MKAMLALISSLLLYNLSAAAAQSLHIERVNYREGDTTLTATWLTTRKSRANALAYWSCTNGGA